jgi:hypothetical protein
MSPVNASVTKQHVVSRVVLSQFAVDRHLEVEDSRRPGRWRLRSPAAVGYVSDFVEHDSGQVEALWQTVETRLPQAISVALQGVAPEPGSPEESTLRDCIALHWARSKAVKTAAHQSWLRVQARHRDEFRSRGDHVLAGLFERRTGRTATPAELDALNAELHTGPEEVLDGRHFAARVPEFYGFARSHLARSHVQVLLCGDGVEDLVMSDAPVLTPSGRRKGLNPSQGVALGDATAAGMPLGPRLFVSMHDVAEVRELTAAGATLLNSLQEQVRVVQMFRRPAP